jgi:hypothetical protein
VKRCFGADERCVEPVKCGGKDADRLGVSEVGECVTTPAGEVNGIECDIRPLVTRWVVG